MFVMSTTRQCIKYSVTRRARYLLSGLVFFLICGNVLAQKQWASHDSSSSLLGDPNTRRYDFCISYIPKSDLAGYKGTTFLETGFDLSFARLDNVIGGGLTFGAGFDSLFFLGDSDASLPDQVASMTFALDWSRQSGGGVGGMICLRPGYYSDIEEMGSDAFFVPFQVALTKRFSRNFAAMAGLWVRFGFERVLLPSAGFAWQVSDGIRLDAMLPSSRLTIEFSDVTLYAGFEWNNTSYALSKEKQPGRKTITIEDFRWSGGLIFPLEGHSEFFFGVGSSYDREIEFDLRQGSNKKIDVEDQIVVTAGLRGRF